MNTEIDSEQLNLDEKILEFENKLTNIGSSVDSLMSVTQSLTFSSSLMSISSDKLFKKPANLPQSITMQSFKFLTRENSITDPKKEEINISNSNCFFGKTTKKMEKEETDPFLWYKTPDLNSFEELEKSNYQPGLTDAVQNCQTISDFFNFLINDLMLILIDKSTNQKISLYNSKSKKIKYFDPSSNSNFFLFKLEKMS